MTTNELRDHTFDGIHEFDSRLPNWWLWSFYLACIFSVFYWIWFHTLDKGDSPFEAYLGEQREAAAKMEELMKQNPVTEDSLIKASQNPAIVAEGKKIFLTVCAACHEADGRGKIGPNLTDKFWINGGTPMEIYNTVFNGGRKDKGMQAWKVNGPLFVQRAVAYVLSPAIRNANVQGGKPVEPEAKELK